MNLKELKDAIDSLLESKEFNKDSEVVGTIGYIHVIGENANAHIKFKGTFPVAKAFQQSERFFPVYDEELGIDHIVDRYTGKKIESQNLSIKEAQNVINYLEFLSMEGYI